LGCILIVGVTQLVFQFRTEDSSGGVVEGGAQQSADQGREQVSAGSAREEESMRGEANGCADQEAQRRQALSRLVSSREERQS
jgi:hypothetical protein